MAGGVLAQGSGSTPCTFLEGDPGPDNQRPEGVYPTAAQGRGEDVYAFPLWGRAEFVPGGAGAGGS